MKNFLFNGTSWINRFVFKQFLAGLEGSFRYHINNPQKLIKASGVQAGQTVLEVGCGSGFFTPALSDIVGEQGLVQSIDLHPVAVETTDRKMQTLKKHNVRVSKIDAHETGFPDESFDTVLVYGVVPAPVISETRLGQEIYRVLKSGGILVIWTIVPFWSPKPFLKAASFNYCNKQNGVHRLQKAAT